MDKADHHMVTFLSRFKYHIVAILAAMMFTSLTIGVGAAQTACTAITTALPPGLANPALICQICSLYTTLTLLVFILALLLLVLGGTIYAVAHVLPGQSRGSAQGYGMGMIIGGIVGLILVLMAPFILNTVINSSGNLTGVINSIPGTGGTLTGLCKLVGASGFLGGT